MAPKDGRQGVMMRMVVLSLAVLAVAMTAAACTRSTSQPTAESKEDDPLPPDDGVDQPGEDQGEDSCAQQGRCYPGRHDRHERHQFEGRHQLPDVVSV